jgi:hypothetical protein
MNTSCQKSHTIFVLQLYFILQRYYNTTVVLNVKNAS